MYSIQLGYIRYMNENRETVRLRNPNAGANEITKLVAEEWTTLPEDKKKPYLEAAEIDKERYNKEFIEYTESKRLMILKTEEMEREKEKEKAVVSPEKPAMEVGKELIREIRSMDYDIPIFTDDFLEHNKTVDTELRLMRKSNIDFEQQNSVLEKLVENMHNGIDKLNRETKQLSNENAMLESYLHKLKSTLVTALESLPGETNETTTVTSENIEKYMQDLHNMISTTPHVNVLNKAKDIIQKLDFQSLNV